MLLGNYRINIFLYDGPNVIFVPPFILLSLYGFIVFIYLAFLSWLPICPCWYLVLPSKSMPTDHNILTCLVPFLGMFPVNKSGVHDTILVLPEHCHPLWVLSHNHTSQMCAGNYLFEVVATKFVKSLIYSRSNLKSIYKFLKYPLIVCVRIKQSTQWE